MASFDIKPEAELVPNFTRASQGIRADRNTSLGNLFKGLAVTLDTGVKEADRYQKEQIRDDIFDQVDAVQDEFGVGDRTFQERDIALARPRELERAGENLDVLQAAYERGALRESHYWARMNSIVRQMRSRYPGYRTEIDGMVSSITGARPANALRAALFREWAADSSSTPTQMDKLVTSAANAGTLPIEYYDRQEQGNPFTFVELQERVAEKNRQVFESRAAAARMSRAASEGDLTSELVKTHAQGTFTNTVQNILNDSLEASGGYSAIKERLDKYQQSLASGQPVSQESLQQDRAMVSQLALDLELALLQQANEPFGEDPNQSIASSLTPKEVQDKIDLAMAPIRLLQDALSTDNPNGVMTAMAAVSDAKLQDNVRRVLEENDVLGGMQVLNEAVGPEVASTVLTLSPRGQSSFVTAMTSLDLASLSAQNRTVLDGFQAAVGVSDEYGAEYLNNTLVALGNVMDSKIPFELKAGEVNFVFADNTHSVLEELDRSSRLDYYRRAASPQMTQKMVALKAAGGQEAWDLYQKWVTYEFQILFEAEVNDLSSFGDHPGVTVRWDPATTSFIHSNNGVFGSGMFATSGPIGDGINTAIHGVVGLIRENGGNVEEEIGLLLQEMGFREGRLGLTEQAKEGWAFKLFTALGLTSEPTPTGGAF